MGVLRQCRKKEVQPIVDAVPLCVALLTKLPGSSALDVRRKGSPLTFAAACVNVGSRSVV